MRDRIVQVILSAFGTLGSKEDAERLFEDLRARGSIVDDGAGGLKLAEGVDIYGEVLAYAPPASKSKKGKPDIPVEAVGVFDAANAWDRYSARGDDDSLHGWLTSLTDRELKVMCDLLSWYVRGPMRSDDPKLVARAEDDIEKIFAVAKALAEAEAGNFVPAKGWTLTTVLLTSMLVNATVERAERLGWLLPIHKQILLAAQAPYLPTQKCLEEYVPGADSAFDFVVQALLKRGAAVH